MVDPSFCLIFLLHESQWSYSAVYHKRENGTVLLMLVVYINTCHYHKMGKY